MQLRGDGTLRGLPVLALLVFAILFAIPGVTYAATDASPNAPRSANPSPTPTPSVSADGVSKVTIQLETDGTDLPDSPVQVIATLGPASAWGDVTLYDGTTKIASGDDYRLRWSCTTDTLGVGTHHLTVDFTPDPTSRYSASHAEVDYVVKAPPAVKPTPTPSVHKSKDPQPIVVTVPSVSVKATSTSRTSPTPTTSPSASVEPTSTSRTSGGGKGPLPFTGMDVIGALTAAAALIGAGLLLVIAGRRRQRGAH
jgi:hypothetical protein